MTQTVYTVLTPDELKELIRDALRQELNLKKEKEYLSSHDVCELLGISLSCLNAYKKAGKIPFKRIGKRVVFSRSDIQSALTNDTHFQKLKFLES